MTKHFYSQPSPLMGFHTQGHTLPALIILKTAKDSSYIPESLKLFKLGNPKPAYHASLISFHGNHSIGSSHS